MKTVDFIDFGSYIKRGLLSFSLLTRQALPTEITITQMLRKLLPVRTLAPSFFRHVPPKSSSSAPSKPERPAVKIVHVGGIVEYYYMAVPAGKIMEKYPSFLLARPTVFQRPWDSLIQPEEILTPGEKFYVVPQRTVRKLRRRIRRPAVEIPIKAISDQSFKDTSISDVSISRRDKDRSSRKSNGPSAKNHRSFKAVSDQSSSDGSFSDASISQRFKVRISRKFTGPSARNKHSINNGADRCEWKPPAVEPTSKSTPLKNEISSGSIFRRHKDRVSSKSTGPPSENHLSHDVAAGHRSVGSSDVGPTSKSTPSMLKETEKVVPWRPRRVRNDVMWSPTLPAIDEVSPV